MTALSDGGSAAVTTFGEVGHVWVEEADVRSADDARYIGEMVDRVEAQSVPPNLGCILLYYIVSARC